MLYRLTIFCWNLRSPAQKWMYDIFMLNVQNKRVSPRMTYEVMFNHLSEQNGFPQVKRTIHSTFHVFLVMLCPFEERNSAPSLATRKYREQMGLYTKACKDSYASPQWDQEACCIFAHSNANQWLKSKVYREKGWIVPFHGSVNDHEFPTKHCHFYRGFAGKLFQIPIQLSYVLVPGSTPDDIPKVCGFIPQSAWI